MEAKELMIGDWVKMRLPDNSYTEIAQLNSVDAVLHGKLIVEPIHLTIEILKANDMYDGYFFIPKQGPQGTKIRIVICERSGIGRDTNMIILFCRYVNELQHALRLCGLNELADKFQV